MTDNINISEVLKNNSYWLDFYLHGVISLEEAERRSIGTLRVKEAYQKDEWYLRKSLRDPNFWSKFYSSRVNS